MSYSSRVYRQRNPKSQDEAKSKPFFSKEKQSARGKKGGSFFQAKLAANQSGDASEQEADQVANKVQRLATTSEEEVGSTNDKRMERDKEKPFQRKPVEPGKEKEPLVQKKGDAMKDKEKNVQKKGEAGKEKEHAAG